METPPKAETAWGQPGESEPEALTSGDTSCPESRRRYRDRRLNDSQSVVRDLHEVWPPGLSRSALRAVVDSVLWGGLNRPHQLGGSSSISLAFSEPTMLPYSCLPKSAISVGVTFSLRSKFAAIQAYRSASVRCAFAISSWPDLASLAYFSASLR
jgi:hypothetical protein